MKRIYPIDRIEKNNLIHKTDWIAEESQMTVFLNDVEVITLLCSPSDFIFLSLGYLLSEGFIHKKSDIKDIVFNEMEQYVNILTFESIKIDSSDQDKKVLTTGCGKGSIFLKTLQEINLLKSRSILTIKDIDIFHLMREFQTKSDLFLQTGGVHSVGLCYGTEIILHKEDIGRHNALDKILGECFWHEIPTSDKILILSGRMAVEIVQKAARSGIQILLSKSAPTSMAIDVANKIGMTLVGFIRGEHMNIYSHAKRIVLSN